MHEYINAFPCIHSPGCPGLVPKGLPYFCCGCRTIYKSPEGKVIGSGDERAIAFTPSMIRNFFNAYTDSELSIKMIWEGREKF